MPIDAMSEIIEFGNIRIDCYKFGQFLKLISVLSRCKGGHFFES